MSRPIPPTYKTRNWPAYNEALKRRGSLTIWFDPEMSWDAAPTGRRGRQQTYSDAAIQTCLSMKVLFGMALRQTTGFVESLLRLVGLNWTVPDFSTLSRRQKTLAGSVAQTGLRPRFPFPRTDLSHSFRDGYSERGVAVQDGDADLEFGDLSVEVPCHEPLAQQLDTMHLCLDAASAVVSTPSSPERAAQVFRRAQGLISRHGSGGDRLPGLRVLAGRDE